MKYCAEYDALLDAFVDGELSPDDSARVREHLKTCGGCRSYVDAALAIRDAFPDENDTEVPEDFAAVVMTAISSGAAPRETVPPRTEPETEPPQTPARRRGWKKILLPLAACFAVAVLVRGIPLGGASSGSAASPSAAMDTAAATAAASAGAEAESPAVYAGAAQESALDAQEAAPAAGEPEVGVEERAAATEKNVFYTASQSAGSAETSDSGAPTEDTADGAAPTAGAETVAPAAAGGTFAAASAESSSGRSVSVTLNAEQRKALGNLLERFVLTEAGPPAVYRLTETQLHDFLAELERLDIAATVTEPSDGKASGGGLLYVSPAD